MLNAAVLAFFSSVLLHALVMRCVNRAGAVFTFVTIGGVIGLALIGYFIGKFGLSAEVVAVAMIYALLCELYVFMFTLALGSISANILILLQKGPTAVDTLRELYEGQTMTMKRMERLHSAGLLFKAPEGSVLTRRGRFTLYALRATRQLFRHETAI